MRETVSYAQAVNRALDKELSETPNAILFGEDVAAPGGVFGVTRGLHAKFGDRVFDTPISEAAILGSAVGAAMVGMRPIAEIMWVDFSLVALDQIVNQAVNVRYVSEGRLKAPITIRTQQGSLPGACAQHSQCLEAIFAHIPGLHVGLPSTPQDAYDMLRAGFNSDDPTLIIESRGFYHSMKAEVDFDAPLEAIGGARVDRIGTDLTVVSWGTMMPRAREAVQLLGEQGVDAELLDMRWVRPLDIESIIRSVEKTGRLVVAHEAHTFLGVGAEILAALAERGISLLAPPVRVGTPPTRIPAAPSLQSAVIPNAERIAQAALLTLNRAVAA